MKKQLLVLLSSLMVALPFVQSCNGSTSDDPVDPNIPVEPEKPNPDKPNPDPEKPNPELQQYKVTFNVPAPEGNNYSISADEAKQFGSESTPFISSYTVEACYKDGGFKFSSKSKAGKLGITFNKEIDIKNVTLDCTQYKNDSAPVSLSAGSFTDTISNVKTGDNTFTLNEKTKNIEISGEIGKRFVLNSITLNGEPDGEGGEVTPPTPETQEPATVKVSTTGTGSASASITNGLSGQKCIISVSHDDTHYVSKVVANGNNVYRQNGEYAFILKPGENLVNVTFVEFVPGEGHPELFESPEVMNFGTRENLGSVDAYYESVRGLKGAALKNELNRIIQPEKRFSYDDLKKSFPYTDANPDDPSCMTLFYTGEQYEISSFHGWSYINREHVWPNSRGTGKSGPGSDKHMQRPCEQKINGSRSSYDFGYVSDKSGKADLSTNNPINKGNYVGGGHFEPKDEFKGDVARIIFYMAACYDSLELARPSDINRFNYFTASYYHGDFEDLYEWATNPGIDPVSKLEMNRNNVIDIDYQHNRNPFIDHPEFIEMIYDKNYSGPGALID